MRKPNYRTPLASLHLASRLFIGFILAVGITSFAQEATVHALNSGSPKLPGRSSTSSINQKNPYMIGNDDVLAVSIWHEPDLSRSVSVRPDGKISLPLIGEIQASGRSVLQLQDDIRKSLSTFVKDPEVVVIVAEIRSQRINVIGQVTRAGTFPLTQAMGVIDAIALAGGLREYAKHNQIYVLRATVDGQRERLPYDYNKVLKGKPGAKEITLEPHDTVVVP